jgi:hypothetical protein
MLSPASRAVLRFAGSQSSLDRPDILKDSRDQFRDSRVNV